MPRQQVHHIFETSRYEVRVSEAKPTHCIDAIGLTMYHAVQDHDDYGDTISHQLNASYAESACLIDNYVVNTHEYSIANATSKPHLTHNPAGICTAKHLVRSKTELHRAPQRADGLEHPDTPIYKKRQADKKAKSGKINWNPGKHTTSGGSSGQPISSMLHHDDHKGSTGISYGDYGHKGTYGGFQSFKKPQIATQAEQSEHVSGPACSLSFLSPCTF